MSGTRLAYSTSTVDAARHQAAVVTGEALRGQVATLRLLMTGHAIKVAREKGFTVGQINSCFGSPARVYPSRSHEGQVRVTGFGLCLVGVPEGAMFRVITMYQDGVLTPLRADQIAAGVKINREV